MGVKQIKAQTLCSNQKVIMAQRQSGRESTECKIVDVDSKLTAAKITQY